MTHTGENWFGKEMEMVGIEFKLLLIEEGANKKLIILIK